VSAARSSTAIATTATAEAAGAYTGRFAPSPTGPLHLGSLAAATASFLEACTRGGRWLIRVEDLDRPRAVPGMADEHLRMFEGLGFRWDGAVRVQSAHLEVYAAALARLRRMHLVYLCTCSRSEIVALRPADAPADDEELHYPGCCRNGPLHPERQAALRLVVPDREVVFDDRWQGLVVDNVAHSAGDFILSRRDGIIAYQLAVVVDDALQGVSDIVRGCDLISSTPRQILLYEALGLPRPAYAHLPLVVAKDGQKLAKSRHAIGIDAREPAAAIVSALGLLAQRPPVELARASVAEVWAWAVANWNPQPLQGVRSVRAPD
jgi:glutamyl-Q tRNA(Asp) synthetase